MEEQCKFKNLLLGIPGCQDRIPHWAPYIEPASPSACVSASLSVSLMNKLKKYIKKKYLITCPLLDSEVF